LQARSLFIPKALPSHVEDIQEHDSLQLQRLYIDCRHIPFTRIAIIGRESKKTGDKDP
jgi:hypothetical protein